MFNRVILVGNLTRDSESIATAGRAMTKMRLATNTHWRNADGVQQESVEFHNVVGFGRLAETAALYCLRGHRILVEGRLRTRQYDGADGARRYSTEVVAESLHLLNARPAADETVAASDDGAKTGAATIAELSNADPMPVVG